MAQSSLCYLASMASHAVQKPRRNPTAHFGRSRVRDSKHEKRRAQRRRYGPGAFVRVGEHVHIMLARTEADKIFVRSVESARLCK